MMGAASTVAPSHGPSYVPASSWAAAAEAEGEGGATVALSVAGGAVAPPGVSPCGLCWAHATPAAPNVSKVNRNANGRAMERCRGTTNAPRGGKTTSLAKRTLSSPGPIPDARRRYRCYEDAVREEGEPRRKALGDGAAHAAPTAPHATPPVDERKRKRNGPERFWRRRSVRLALGPFLVLSLALHYLLFPIELPHGFEVNDVEGEAAIPIDVLTADPEPPPPPPSEPPPPPATPGKTDEEKARELAAAAARTDAAAAAVDAGAAQDAAPQ